jgi:hypothetical protein
MDPVYVDEGRMAPFLQTPSKVPEIICAIDYPRISRRIAAQTKSKESARGAARVTSAHLSQQQECMKPSLRRAGLQKLPVMQRRWGVETKQSGFGKPRRFGR